MSDIKEERRKLSVQLEASCKAERGRLEEAQKKTRQKADELAGILKEINAAQVREESIKKYVVNARERLNGVNENLANSRKKLEEINGEIDMAKSKLMVEEERTSAKNSVEQLVIDSKIIENKRLIESVKIEQGNQAQVLHNVANQRKVLAQELADLTTAKAEHQSKAGELEKLLQTIASKEKNCLNLQKNVELREADIKEREEKINTLAVTLDRKNSMLIVKEKNLDLVQIELNADLARLGDEQRRVDNLIVAHKLGDKNE